MAAVLIALMANILVFFFRETSLFKNNEPDSFSFSGHGQNTEESLEESSAMEKSASADWWLNSGGILNISKNEFSTNIGKMPKNSSWRKLYAKNNPRDTDKGYFPQNLFRLVSKSQWKDLSQQVYFYIEKINLSESDYRNESNGVLLFNRYQDGDNLYYTGLRVDGHAIIKKKIGDKYYTLKEKAVLTDDEKYDRVDNPNLIPEEEWIGIKSEVTNVGRNTVNIKLFLDREQTGDWELVLEAKDKGDQYGDEPFRQAGRAGIRTDFMDVRFKNYSISEMK